MRTLPSYCMAFMMLLSIWMLIFNIKWNFWAKERSFKTFDLMKDLINISGKLSEEHSKCRPKKNIVFSKNYKCGSDTVQNILLRYGDNNNLSFLIPEKDINFNNKPLSKESVQSLPWVSLGIFNIFCVHTRFVSKTLHEVMPPDTVYVTIVREPSSHFESIYNYYELRKMFKMPFAEFSLINKTQLLRKGFGFRVRNPQLYNLGVYGKYSQNKSFFENEVKNIDKIFDLVMITDMMTESMVLLKELMCWQLKDVTAFKRNSRTDIWRESEISVKVKEGIAAWNIGDTILYDYFRKKLVKKITEFGQERMKREVNLLQQLNKQLYEECVLNEQVSKELPEPLKHWSNKVLGFRLRPQKETNLTCLQMAAAPSSYVKHLRNKQYEWIRNTKGRNLI
ncbi:galactosylceramide sulfotransferase-like [Tachypleus tridentatus]|uniref:galactosylceramide sulfotransferase-like n=1 Tax=Tachypleus tridentatus TaxID=6853 RepID=UPI003FD0739D